MEIKVINNVDLDNLDLSVRTWNCLRRALINNVQDIVDNIDNLPRVRNLGQKCYDEVLDKIKPYIEEVDRICITNYDRIKSMSVDEMAVQMTEYKEYDEAHDIYYRCPDGKHFQEHEYDKAVEYTKQWLLQEVIDDE